MCTSAPIAVDPLFSPRRHFNTLGKQQTVYMRVCVSVWLRRLYDDDDDVCLLFKIIGRELTAQM